MSGPAREWPEGWHLGASDGSKAVAHCMRDRGVQYAAFGARFDSRCGLFLTAVLKPAPEGVRRCRRCVAFLAADAERPPAPRQQVPVRVALERRVAALEAALGAVLDAYSAYIESDVLEPLAAAVGSARAVLEGSS
jgi:hypothetical protein